MHAACSVCRYPSTVLQLSDAPWSDVIESMVSNQPGTGCLVHAVDVCQPGSEYHTRMFDATRRAHAGSDTSGGERYPYNA